MRCEERSGYVQKRLRPVTTVNSTLLIKYTCTVCMCHEEIHAQKWDMYMYNIMYAVYSTQHWFCGHTGTCSNNYGVLSKKTSLVPRLSSSPAYIIP